MNKNKKQTVATEPEATVLAKEKFVTLELVSVVISKGVTAMPSDDPQGVYFLRKNGFTAVRSLWDEAKHVEGIAPTEHVVHIKYQLTGDDAYMPFTMSWKPSYENVEVEHGDVYKVRPPKPDGTVTLLAHGQTITDWKILARPVTDSPVSSKEPANGLRECRLVPTSELLIEEACQNTDKLAKVKKPKLENEPEQLFDDEPPPLFFPKNVIDKWPYNPLIRHHMDEHCGGDHTALGASRALHAIMKKEGLNLDGLVAKFSDYSATITRILAICNLHPDLAPMLDKKKGDPERLTPEVLHILVKIPINEQVKIWRKAKKLAKNKNAAVVYQIKVIGDNHIGQFEMTKQPFWVPRNEVVVP